MQLKYDSKIEGDFEGWDGDAVYELTNGTKWQLSKYTYKYKYKYRPKVKLWKDGNQYYLEVECMSEKMKVRPFDDN